MSRRHLLTALILTVLLAGHLSAQHGSWGQNPGGKTVFAQPKGFLDALFDASRFTMSHSYSMSAGAIGKQSFNQGLYLNTMSWKLADPLFMQLRVGYAHQPLGGNSLFGESSKSGQFFLQQAYLEYKPFKNAKLTFEYQSMPQSSFYHSPFGLSRNIGIN